MNSYSSEVLVIVEAQRGTGVYQYAAAFVSQVLVDSSSGLPPALSSVVNNSNAVNPHLFAVQHLGLRSFLNFFLEMS